MAKRDIAGLLTGIPSGGIDPRVGLTGRQMLVQSALAGQERMAGGLRGMMGNMGIQEQIISAAGSKQRDLQDRLEQLDLTTTEGLQGLAKIQQEQGDVTGAVKTLSAISELKEQEGLRKTLIDIANSQGRNDVVEFLINGGDLTKASEVVFRAGTLPKAASLTDNEELLYQDFLEGYSKKDLQTLGVKTGVLGGLSDAQERSIFNKAEEIYTNNPELGREASLREAIRIAGGGTTSGSTQATPTGSDPYGGYNVTNVN
jgi:hypothetical protein